MAIVTDPAGNAFFFDAGNRKLKKIAPDAAHTVTTLATLPANGPDSLTGLTRLGSMIYAVGNDTASSSYVLGFDTTSGMMTTVKQGAGDAFAPLDSSMSPTLMSIATDGQGLMVSGRGYIWYVTLGGAVHVIAGTGTQLDFPQGYDPKAPHPAGELALRYTLSDVVGDGASDFMAYKDGAIYWRGHADGI